MNPTNTLSTTSELEPIHIGLYRSVCRGCRAESEGSEVFSVPSLDEGADSWGTMTTGAAGAPKVGPNDSVGPVPGPGVNIHETA